MAWSAEDARQHAAARWRAKTPVAAKVRALIERLPPRRRALLCEILHREARAALSVPIIARAEDLPRAMAEVMAEDATAIAEARLVI
jgi:hypothetical protein